MRATTESSQFVSDVDVPTLNVTGDFSPTQQALGVVKPAIENHDLFPMSEHVAKQVAFWEQVFSGRYSKIVVIHDSEYPPG